jgi:hypothetical protein
MTTEETTLAELSDRVKARAVPPSTFARAGGGRLDPAAWLVRLDKAAETLEADIHRRGPRDFTELMVVLEKSYCPECDGRAATCPLADFVAKSKRWAGSEFCPACFGRFVGTVQVLDKDGKPAGERRIYADSEPFTLLGKRGDRFVVARCDCKPAVDRYGLKCPPSPTLRDGLCAVRRWPVERAVMDKTYARWKREALDNQPGAS